MRAAALSAAVYLALTGLLGAGLIGGLDRTIANDPGDPLFIASILTWNAEHIPLTEAWWQFPIFHPTRDVLAFSEHMLGLSVVAAPVYWLTGSTLATYNLTLLLTYPLCGMAMFALVYRLTRSSAAAFLAGLAYAFAPIRVSQLSHVQLLATFYAPLGLLGLHAYLETHRRRWLVLFGLSWMLQGAVTGYLLIYGSVLIACWVVWFVVAPGRWREIGPILVALALASVPLAPILLKYSDVHQQHGFVRGFSEAGLFGADITALFCAPTLLSFWGWLRVGCKPEGEIFPGVALIVLCGLGWLVSARKAGSTTAPPVVPVNADSTGQRRTTRISGVRRALLAGSALFGAIALGTLLFGPWKLALGPVSGSASSPMKPFSTAMVLLLFASLLSPRLAAAARRSSVHGFYLFAAVGTWVLSWGPEPGFLGTQVLYQAPFAWLIRMPGGDALRVPARFWLLTLLCLTALMGILLAELLKRQDRRVRALIVVAAACGLAVDGWAWIPAMAVPSGAPAPAVLSAGVVLELPLGEPIGDIAAVYRAVTGGWRTVNGYSGYEPADYAQLREASEKGEDAILRGLIEQGGLHVLVSERAPDLDRMVARQPGVELVGRAGGLTQYRLSAPPAGRATLRRGLNPQ